MQPLYKKYFKPLPTGKFFMLFCGLQIFFILINFLEINLTFLFFFRNPITNSAMPDKYSSQGLYAIYLFCKSTL